MDKNSFMWLPVGTLQAEIHNHERIRDNHAKKNDKKNVDYLNTRISKYKEAIEILKKAETSKEKALNIGSVSGSLPKCSNCKWVCIDNTCGNKESPLYNNEVSKKDTCMFHDR